MNAGRKPLDSTKFDVEHGLNIFASSFAIFPAQNLYDEGFIGKMRQCSKSFHIYLIGYVPKINVDTKEGTLRMRTTVNGEKFILEGRIPDSTKLVREGNNHYLKNQDGTKELIDSTEIMRLLNEEVGCPFMVKYIGQSFGTDGSRDALDRLMHHETLQKIALKSVPDGYTLQVILLEIQTPNRIITIFHPNAENNDDDGVRLKQGLDKLYGTTTEEKVSLYEAALIRYFRPEFNDKLKDSFPSTNLKMLNDCYSKDILMLISEICIQGLPVSLCSETVKSERKHIITHDLQKDSDRKIFFAMNGLAH